MERIFTVMDLVRVAPPDFDIDIDLAYGGTDNFTGRPVYARAEAWLHAEAARRLSLAIGLAARQGLRLCLFDAFRPAEAQWALWSHTPDPDFLADPRSGSHHSRGVAVDLTLVEGESGTPLDMGTGFDAFTPASHHGSTAVAAPAQRNRFLLLGLMTSAGWKHYAKEWWHYQLPDARRYPLLSDSVLPRPMMAGKTG